VLVAYNQADGTTTSVVRFRVSAFGGGFGVPAQGWVSEKLRGKTGLYMDESDLIMKRLPPGQHGQDSDSDSDSDSDQEDQALALALALSAQEGSGGPPLLAPQPAGHASSIHDASSAAAMELSGATDGDTTQTNISGLTFASFGSASASASAAAAASAPTFASFGEGGATATGSTVFGI